MSDVRNITSLWHWTSLRRTFSSNILRQTKAWSTAKFTQRWLSVWMAWSCTQLGRRVFRQTSSPKDLRRYLLSRHSCCYAKFNHTPNGDPGYFMHMIRAPPTMPWQYWEFQKDDKVFEKRKWIWSILQTLQTWKFWVFGVHCAWVPAARYIFPGEVSTSCKITYVWYLM